MSEEEAKAKREEEAAEKVKKGSPWGLFATRQLIDTSDDPELRLKITIRELFIYVIFLATANYVTLDMASDEMYYHTRAMTDLFVEADDDNGDTFSSLTNLEQFWNFMRGPLLDGLFWKPPAPGNQSNSTTATSPPKDVYILYENKLVSRPSIRTKRVKSTCTLPSVLDSNLYVGCYPEMDLAEEVKSLTGLDYKTAEDLKESDYEGQAGTYSGSGFLILLPQDKPTAEAEIETLFANELIQRDTRVVFIDFAVYNGNVNLFCVVRLVAEFLATGGVLPSWEVNSVRLVGREVGTPALMVFIVFVVYFIGEELVELYANKLSHFSDFFNFLDLAVIASCLTYFVKRQVTPEEDVKALLAKPDTEYKPFYNIAEAELSLSTHAAITLFLVWIKVFKYLSFTRTLDQLSSTLRRCAKDLINFFFMFLVVFAAFTLSGFTMFVQLKGFSTYTCAFYTLFRVILGDFDFEELYKAAPVIGPIYFILFIVFVFFILINVFLAIINDAFAEAKAESASRPTIELSELMIRCCRKAKDKDAEIKQFREDLISRGYAEADIDAVFEDHKLKSRLDPPDERLKSQIEKELEEMKSGGEKKRVEPLSTEPVTYEEFMVLARRVDRLEHSIGSVVAKLDAILVRLEAVDRTKEVTRHKGIPEEEKDQMKKAVKKEMSAWKN